LQVKKVKIKLIKEFTASTIKGNMMYIATGVIIGAAFNKITDVLVEKVMLTALSLLTDGINWQTKKIILREAISQNRKKRPLNKLRLAKVNSWKLVLTLSLLALQFLSL
jgi:large conductance mechanosensitive channel protein